MGPRPWAPDDGSSYTDSASYADTIAECTNLSVGCFGAHSTDEELDIAFLEQLAQACREIDWEGLPVARLLGR